MSGFDEMGTKKSYIQSPMEARHSSNQAMLFITFFLKKMEPLTVEEEFNLQLAHERL